MPPGRSRSTHVRRAPRPDPSAPRPAAENELGKLVAELLAAELAKSDSFVVVDEDGSGVGRPRGAGVPRLSMLATM